MIVVAVIGALGWLVAFWLWVHLYLWARECKGARITIAYKTKVKIDAPLVEWLLWIRQANKDKASGGRVVYQVGGTSVAILKRVKVSRFKRRKKVDKTPRTGRWSATDQTKPSQLSHVSRVTTKEKNEGSIQGS